MRKLRELTRYASLQELVEILESEIVDGETAPEAKPEGEKKFVKLHKTEKHADPYGNKKASDATKKDTSHKEPLPGFPPEVKEEEEIEEAAALGRAYAKKAHPLIKRPKFDERGNVVLTKDAKANIEYGKGPRSRKLTGTPYTGAKRFGEEKEEDIDESKAYPKTPAMKKAWAKKMEKHDKDTVLVTNKGSSEALRGGGVRRIPKHKYNPNVHNLAEKWGVDDAVNPAEKGKYAGWTLEKLRAAKSKPGADQKELNFAIRAKTNWGKVKEETQLDELKKETLANYIRGRTSHLAGAAYSAGAAGATNQPREAGAQTKKLHKYQKGIKQAAERIGGSYESGKPVKVMIPGRTDKDKASGPYTIPKRKLYHGEETEQLDEVITKDTPAGNVIHDFVHSKNKVFSGDSKKQRIKRALGAYYGKQRGK